MSGISGARAPSSPRIPATRSWRQTPSFRPALEILKEFESEAMEASTRASCIGMATGPRPTKGWPKAYTSPVASSTWVTVPLAMSTRSPPIRVAPMGLPGRGRGGGSPFPSVWEPAPAAVAAVRPPGAGSIPSCRNSGPRASETPGSRPPTESGARRGTGRWLSHEDPPAPSGGGPRSPAGENGVRPSVGIPAGENDSESRLALAPPPPGAPRSVGRSSVKRTISSKGVMPQIGSREKGKA